MKQRVAPSGAARRRIRKGSRAEPALAERTPGQPRSKIRGRPPASPLSNSGSTELYRDPAYYDKTYRSRKHDVAYYVKLARRYGGPILEYGVGTGRIALPIAQAGIEVVGVDASQTMLDRLSARLDMEAPQTRRHLRLVCGDMCKVRLRKRFALVLCTFNTIMHLYERRDLEAFLARVRGHLRPGARFVFDFSVPHPEDLASDPGQRYYAPRIRHPTTGELTRYSERFEYHTMQQLLLIEMEFESLESKRVWTTPLLQRQFFPQEMEALLHYNGFGDFQWTRDFSDAAPNVYVDSLVMSCRSRPGFRAPSA